VRGPGGPRTEEDHYLSHGFCSYSLIILIGIEDSAQQARLRTLAKKLHEEAEAKRPLMSLFGIDWRYGAVRSGRMKTLSSIFLLVSFVTTAGPACFAQSNGVPANILSRVVYLRNGSTYGSGFLIDYKDQQYLITARHIVEGLDIHNPKVRFYRSADWHDMQSELILPKNKNIDIAILDIHQKASKQPIIDLTGATPTIGGQVYFLGFPYGLHSLYNNGEYLPLVKVGVFSGLDNRDQNEVVYFIDGFVNPGFSGGPCVYIDNSEHKWHIFAVVQGFRNESIKTKFKGRDVDTGLLVNSGILLAYPITDALAAIDLVNSK
jgi:S1-C subfamily serine protease